MTDVGSHHRAPSSTSRHRRTSSSHSQKKPWESRGPLYRSSTSRSRPEPEEVAPISKHHTRSSTRSKRRQPRWWKVQLFKGMLDDVKRRAPYYWSDWRDAWDYRVVPATVYMYFANILPALAFSLDMFVKTDNSYGVNEVLLASVLGCVVFSLLAAQPLVIVGVTGPITVFSYTVYDIVVPLSYNYFGFMAWIGIWSLILHWILAITNSCNALTYVTRFSCDTFGFYVAFVYLQKGIQVLTRQWGEADATSAYLSITISLLVLGVAFLCGVIGESKLFHRHVRKFIEDYGTPLTIVFFTGFVHIGHMASVELPKLPTSRAFFPTADRSWAVSFWDVSAAEVFIALPFGILLTILFWFDHNVSSLIAQGSEFPLRKPPGFHWDIFLLGLTTGIAGILGIPLPNGLIPQAPFHTQSLCVTKSVPIKDSPPDPNKPARYTRVTTHVVEQRLSNLAQGLLFLVTMSGPLLSVLHLIPQGVLAGLFFVMGVQALIGNGITLKLVFLLSDRDLIDPSSEPLARLPRRTAIWAFVALELAIFGATFAITQTVAAIGFPVIIIISIPFRTFLMPRWFRDHELRILDAPTAGDFVMESVGGAYGAAAAAENDDHESRSRSPTPPSNGRTTADDGEDTRDESCAVLDDVLERGESYELSEGGHLPSGRANTNAKTGRRATGSQAERDMERPEIASMRRRSSRGRGKGSRLD